MKRQVKPYQQLFSALLGLLYLFIVTPVQYWHQHTIKPAKSTEQKYVWQYQEDSGNTDINCAVCSHKYSGCQLQVEEPFFALLTCQTIVYTNNNLPVVEGIYTTLCNKGPPVLFA